MKFFVLFFNPWRVLEKLGCQDLWLTWGCGLGFLQEAKAPSLMMGWGCHCQYKASCSHHFISEDAQERQDKEVFQQNMKRRLESFKSTKHNICFTKSKPHPRKTGRKKACAFSGSHVWGWRLTVHGFEPPSIGTQPRGPLDR